MMPKDRGGIGRMGNKHLKLSIFDKHREFKFKIIKLKLRGVYATTARREQRGAASRREQR